MEHKRIDDLRGVASVHTVELPLMSRRERLERWAELLEANPQRRLKALEEIDLAPCSVRPSMRADNSPLTVAFQDPVLRSQGLASDTLGDALTFFGMSHREAHRILCSCLNGRTMEAGRAARGLRSIARRTKQRIMAGCAIGGAVTMPVFIYLFG